MTVETITTIISMGIGAGNFFFSAKYLSLMSLKLNKTVNPTIEITKTAIFVLWIFLKISMIVFINNIIFS